MENSKSQKMKSVCKEINQLAGEFDSFDVTRRKVCGLIQQLVEQLNELKNEFCNDTVNRSASRKVENGTAFKSCTCKEPMVKIKEVVKEVSEKGVPEKTYVSRSVSRTSSGNFEESISTSARAESDFTYTSDVRSSDINKVPMTGQEIEYANKIRKIIEAWVKTVKVIQEELTATDIVAFIEDMVKEIVDRKKYLQLNPEIIENTEDEIEDFKFIFFKVINKYTVVDNVMPFICPLNNLYNSIDKVYVGPFIISNIIAIKDEIQRYIQEVPSNMHVNEKSDSIKDLKELAILIGTLIDQQASEVEIEEILKEWMPKFFLGDPEEVARRALQLKNKLKASGLIRKRKRNCVQALNDDIKEWCDNLPIRVQGKHQDEVTIKENIAYKILHKVAEMNLNMELFNDSYSYEVVLIEELDYILDTLPPNPELLKYLPCLKNCLVQKIKASRKCMLDDLTGKNFKQQLRDSLNSSFCTKCLEGEEWVSFELLKEELVDAFVALSYAPENQDLIIEYKSKISDEIMKFCNNYLRRHPDSPITKDKLNFDLLSALQAIPLPVEMVMKKEVEMIEIKHKLNEWFNNNVPPEMKKSTASCTDLLNRNKLITLIAECLFQMEQERKSGGRVDMEKLSKQILKWLKKIFKCSSDSTKLWDMSEDLIRTVLSRKKKQKRRCRCSSKCSQTCLNVTTKTDVTTRTSLPNLASSLSCPERPSFFPKTSDFMSSTQKPSEVPPRVIVKEYFWDSSLSDTCGPCNTPPPVSQEHCESCKSKASLGHQQSSNQSSWSSKCQSSLQQSQSHENANQSCCNNSKVQPRHSFCPSELERTCCSRQKQSQPSCYSCQFSNTTACPSCLSYQTSTQQSQANIRLPLVNSQVQISSEDRPYLVGQSSQTNRTVTFNDSVCNKDCLRGPQNDVDDLLNMLRLRDTSSDSDSSCEKIRYTRTCIPSKTGDVLDKILKVRRQNPCKKKAVRKPVKLCQDQVAQTKKHLKPKTNRDKHCHICRGPVCDSPNCFYYKQRLPCE